MKTKNENNVYTLTCKVTNEIVKTNPNQFNDTVARMGITDEMLKNNYVSRNGRNLLKSRGLTASQASAEFGIDIVMAKQLKNLAKEPIAVVSTTNIIVEVPTSAILADTQTESTPVDFEDHVVAGSSVNELVAA